MVKADTPVDHLGDMIAQLKSQQEGMLVPAAELDIEAMSEEVDEAEIDKMLLRTDEKALKTRIWNELNSDWIKEQKTKETSLKQ